MHLRDILRGQLDLAYATFGPIDIIETGTVRNADPRYELDDGWSTVIFAEWCKEHERCHLDSIDLVTDVASDLLRARDLGHLVRLMEGHSVEVLGDLIEMETRTETEGRPGEWPLKHIHIAYLDSDNDSTLILCEYLLVTRMMPRGAIVMVDDCDPATGGNKGNAIRPWLEAKGIEYTLVGRRGDGYATNVLITRVP